MHLYIGFIVFSISISNQEKLSSQTAKTSGNAIESTDSQNKYTVVHSIQTENSDNSPAFNNAQHNNGVDTCNVVNTASIDDHTPDFTSVWNQYNAGPIPSATNLDYTFPHSMDSRDKHSVQNSTETAHDIPQSDSARYNYVLGNSARPEMNSSTTRLSKKKKNKHSMSSIIQITNVHGTTPPSISAQNKYIVDNIAERAGKSDDAPQYTTLGNKYSARNVTETCSNNEDSSIQHHSHAERTANKDEIISPSTSVWNKHSVGTKHADGNVPTSLSAHNKYVGNVAVTLSKSDAILVSTSAVGDVTEIDGIDKYASFARNNHDVRTEKTDDITSNHRSPRNTHSVETKCIGSNAPTFLSAHNKYYVRNVAETESTDDTVIHSTSAQNNNSARSEIPDMTTWHSSNSQNKYCIGNFAETGMTNGNSTPVWNKVVLRTGSTSNTTLHPANAWCKQISMNTPASMLVNSKSAQRKYTMANDAAIGSSDNPTVHLTSVKNKYAVGDVLDCESTDDGQGTENTDFSILHSADEENRYYMGHVVEHTSDTILDATSAVYKDAASDVAESSALYDAAPQLTVAPNKPSLMDASKDLTVSHSRSAQNKNKTQTQSNSTNTPNRDVVKSAGIGNAAQHSASSQDKCAARPEIMCNPLPFHTRALDSKYSVWNGEDIEHLEESIPQTVRIQNKCAKKTKGSSNKYAVGNDDETASANDITSDSTQMEAHGKGL